MLILSNCLWHVNSWSVIPVNGFPLQLCLQKCSTILTVLCVFYRSTQKWHHLSDNWIWDTASHVLSILCLFVSVWVWLWVWLSATAGKITWLYTPVSNVVLTFTWKKKPSVVQARFNVDRSVFSIDTQTQWKKQLYATDLCDVYQSKCAVGGNFMFRC